MIVTKISDGFGNQLFMYACGYAAAKRLSTKLALDITYLSTNSLRNYELDKLNIVYDKIYSVDNIQYPLNIVARKIIHFLIRCKYKIFKEKEAYKYDKEILSICKNSYLFGYWQTEEYFKEYRDDILRIFTPKYKLSKGCELYINEVSKCNSVAIHVRRGDYVNLGICLDKSYYHEALLKIKEKISNSVYYVFSDDLEFSKELFKDEKEHFHYVLYESQNATIEDLLIMKSCNHIIMANSSYSWWAAWLNNNSDKIVIYPKNKQSMIDFYPEEWIEVE